MKSLEQGGSLFIKLGQWASTRRDLFSDETCDILSILQSKVTPHSYKKSRETIENEIGGMESFKWFDEIPIGVGAVAQVSI